MFKYFLLFSIVALALAAPSVKIEPKLAKTLRTKNIADIVVKFDNGNKNVLSQIHSLRFANRGDKIAFLVSALKEAANTSQRNVVSLLASPRFAYSSVTFQQIWISNELSITGANAELVRQVASLPEVSEIREAVIIRFDDAVPSSGKKFADNDWNLKKVEAENAWGLPGGNNGQGVVVSHIDSGVRATHESLRNNFRREYGWYDISSKSAEPSDELGHGTHTMGTIAGAGVGIAPGSQWISCKPCTFICSEVAFKQCGEWTLCPTLTNGSNPDCSKAPHLSSNSWGYSDASFFSDVVDAWHEAGIIPIFALGNEGPRCGNNRGPGNWDNVIGVGATDSEDVIASFSSLGPSPQGTIKPDISAPGKDVYSASASSDNQYELMSGTSMACPHTAGVVSLLLSRDSSLTYNQIKQILEDNTDRNLGTGPVCDNTQPNVFPNNVYGHGRLNARKSLLAVINRNSTLIN